jgi:hypothetical protein
MTAFYHPRAENIRQYPAWTPVLSGSRSDFQIAQIRILPHLNFELNSSNMNVWDKSGLETLFKGIAC